MSRPWSLLLPAFLPHHVSIQETQQAGLALQLKDPSNHPQAPAKSTHTHIHNAHGPGSCHCVPQPELSTVHFGASPETLSDCFPGPIYGGFVRTTVGYCCFSESLFKKQNAVPGQAGNNEDKRMFLTTLFSRSERTMNAIVRNPLFFHLFIY